LNLNNNEFYKYESTISSAKRIKYGIVYTPMEIVDYINFHALREWNKKRPPLVLDPCCGTGVFLHDMAIKIANRWNLDIDEVYEKYIFGFDKDAEAIQIGKELLPGANLKACDSLREGYSDYDIIVTNPPYIRIQNLDEEDRKFIKDNHEVAVGSTDIYIAFLDKLYESKKIVGLICPNSWIRNKSSNLLRQKIFNGSRLKMLIDFRSKLVFDSAQTYTSILLIANHSESLKYSTNLDEESKNIEYLKSDKQSIFLGKELEMQGGQDIFDVCDFKIGLATLCDGMYFCSLVEDEEKLPEGLWKIKNSFGTFVIEQSILKKCVKASKRTKSVDDKTFIVFPYGHDRKLMSETHIKKTYPKAYNMLLGGKDRLLQRDKGKIPKEKWYAFGRSQGLKNNVEKILLPPFQKDCIKTSYSGTDEYYISGYAVIPKKNYTLKQIKTFLESSECYEEVKDKAKSMSSGWIGLSKNTFKEVRVPSKFLET
jgi:adenine-specific DNA-methyltransferase